MYWSWWLFSSNAEHRVGGLTGSVLTEGEGYMCGSRSEFMEARLEVHFNLFWLISDLLDITIKIRKVLQFLIFWAGAL